MTSITLRKILVAAAAVSALSVAACNKPAETTNTTNVVENTTVTEVVPADANAVPADANAVSTTNTTMTTNTTTTP